MKRFVLAAACCIMVSATLSPAHIYNWQTGAVISGTENITPGPGVDLEDWSPSRLGRTLNYAQLSGYDLSGGQFWMSWLRHAKFVNSDLTESRFGSADLTGADFTGADLTHSYLGAELAGVKFTNANMTDAWLDNTNVTGADFTDAIISGAHMESLTGFTQEQFYSTASYKAHSLTHIYLSGNDMPGYDLSDQDLAYSFLSGNLAGSDFSRANAAEASIYGDLTGANFTGANLTMGFVSGTLTNAVFAGAIVKNAYLGSGLTKEQLYSTASYAAKDLGSISLTNNDMTKWVLAGQNMAGADLWKSKLIGADLRGTNLTNAYFGSADFSRADLRAANVTGSTGTFARDDTIWTDGSIDGLQLASGEELMVRNHDMAITANGNWTMTQGSSLKMVLEGGWKSVMNVGDGVTPNLGGTLELAFAEGVDIASLIGTEFKLFNWNGRLADGNCFDAITTAPGTEWDTSRLYTDGVVTLVPEPLTLAMLVIGGLVVRRKK